MFEATVLSAEPISSSVGSLPIAQNNSMISAQASPPLSSASSEITNEQTLFRDTSHAAGVTVNQNFTTSITAATASISSSTTTTTSDPPNNSSDNVVGSGSASRKTSTASEYTSLSSDYTPDNTITSSASAFTMENPNYANNEDEICSKIIAPPLQSSTGVMNTEARANSLNVFQLEKSEILIHTDEELESFHKSEDIDQCQDNIEEQGKALSRTADVMSFSALSGRKISRFLVNPVISSGGDGTLEVTTNTQFDQIPVTPVFTEMREITSEVKARATETLKKIQKEGEIYIPDSCDKAVVSENFTTTVLITSAPMPMVSSNNVVSSAMPTLSATTVNNVTSNTLEQLKIELENITHAHAFANSVVASLHNTTDQNQIQPQPSTSTFSQQLQHQEEVNKPSPTTTAQSLGQSTPAGIINSARGSSVYNSRRTSLDISGGSDFQHLTTNVIEGVESLYQVPNSQMLTNSGGASCTSAHTPIDPHSEVGVIMGSSSIVSAGAGLAECATGHRQPCGLTKSSLADLEKKLAALRNVDVGDETKVPSTLQSAILKAPDDQRSARKISRFSVSRVQEKRSTTGNGNTFDVPTTPPICTDSQKMRIDLQAITNPTVAPKSSIVNTPTEVNLIPGQYIAVTSTIGSGMNNENPKTHHIYPQTLHQPTFTQLQLVQPTQSYTQSQTANQVLQQQQFLQQLLLQKRAATPAFQPQHLLQSNFSSIQQNILQRHLIQQQMSSVGQHVQQQAPSQVHLAQRPQLLPNQKSTIHIPDASSPGQNQQSQSQSQVPIQQPKNKQVQIQHNNNQQQIHQQSQQQQQVQNSPNQQPFISQPYAQNQQLSQMQSQTQSQNQQHQHSQHSIQQTTQPHIVTQQTQPPYSGGEISDHSVMMPVSNEEPVSLAATHPQLLPTVIQSDIKHNLDSLVNQLCNMRLRSNQHQRLLLLRQRQLIEEDELRLKHYVEYEKFQKALRQSGETQPQVLYVQPPPSQHGFLNLGAENSLSQVRGSKPATNLQSTFATGINQTQPVQQATLQQTHPQQSFQIGQYTNQSTVTSATGNITQEQLAQRQQYFQKFLCQLLSNCGNNIQNVSNIPDSSLASLVHVFSQLNTLQEKPPEMVININPGEEKLPSVQNILFLNKRQNCDVTLSSGSSTTGVKINQDKFKTKKDVF
ncbi:uncharacterized protein LOC101451678 isoform X1 [Ceratitis capitata]|uniref:uncharacterized protein LOC101451678 isoform X1 n=1 Tax=Ceratitis capitata TaxID=7213 RepID=UPI000C6C5CD3|nr:uncharacterized protein LOC101451678 isoform X1 [Ceratitis capitata]XP_023159033.1 uncharacterized protein LOC101451678 isoform X1 [Ceratitis capitata]